MPRLDSLSFSSADDTDESEVTWWGEIMHAQRQWKEDYYFKKSEKVERAEMSGGGN
jgi:hypothetical protein